MILADLPERRALSPSATAAPRLSSTREPAAAADALACAGERIRWADTPSEGDG